MLSNKGIHNINLSSKVIGSKYDSQLTNAWEKEKRKV